MAKIVDIKDKFEKIANELKFTVSSSQYVLIAAKESVEVRISEDLSGNVISAEISWWSAGLPRPTRVKALAVADAIRDAVTFTNKLEQQNVQ